LTPENIFSALALIVSLVALYKSVRSAKLGNEIQRRLLGIEHARERDRLAERDGAAVRAEIIKGPKGAWDIRIHNRGPSEARNIQVYLDDIPLAQSARVHARSAAPFVLGPGTHRDFPVQLTLGSRADFNLAITWTDNAQPEGRWRATL
jgi:hypothetical protein